MQYILKISLLIFLNKEIVTFKIAIFKDDF